jgi:hypothetical protein
MILTKFVYIFVESVTTLFFFNLVPHPQFKRFDLFSYSYMDTPPHANPFSNTQIDVMTSPQRPLVIFTYVGRTHPSPLSPLQYDKNILHLKKFGICPYVTIYSYCHKKKRPSI